MDVPKMKVSVLGAGYVGFSNAVTLSEYYDVQVVDTDLNKVTLINKGISPINDASILEFYKIHGEVSISATTDLIKGVEDANWVLIALPTNYDEILQKFDVSILIEVIDRLLELNPHQKIVIRSTVPVGFTDEILTKHPNASVIFSPEFLREGSGIPDAYFPSRIILGSRDNQLCREYISFLGKVININNDKLLIVSPSEAESIKLFANAYLAMRVNFFNELDSFALLNKLNTQKIIQGVCLDSRIGNHYNNPSFGYGGYCLPKDSKALRSTFRGMKVPQKMISALIESNVVRKKFIIEDILKKNPKVIGIYRVVMKTNSDNWKESCMLDIIDGLKAAGCEVLIYDPIISENFFKDCIVLKSLDELICRSDIVIANRLTKDISHHEKVYTRDIYGEN